MEVTPSPTALCSRDERFKVKPGADLSALLKSGADIAWCAELLELSHTGALLALDGEIAAGVVVTLCLMHEGKLAFEDQATVMRVDPRDPCRVAVAFSARPPLEALSDALLPQAYVRDELAMPQQRDRGGAARMCRVNDFFRLKSPDLFAKCVAFSEGAGELQRAGMYQALYRVTLTTALDHRAVVFNPLTGREEVMVCFDSNSYLGLHLHPKVVAASRAVLDLVGYGTPSAQVLGGTSRYLRELEARLCEFYGREDAIVFPSGYAANQGLLTALLREDDLVVRDQFSHASIQDGSAMSLSHRQRVFRHGDLASLEKILTSEAQRGELQGRLIATDGVFSMHGAVADLPGLVSVAARHGARLLVDEAHATGVYGATGHGTEELFGMPGSIDVLMGTFSKAPGTIGGYVCGSKALVTYLRFFARSGLFTAALPAHLCAGVTEAFNVMEREPEHRERLWANTFRLHAMLMSAGLPVSPTVSPIITVFSGATPMLWSLAASLFASGVKVGTVDHPAVARGETILRITVNARHTEGDLEQLCAALLAAYKGHGLLGKTTDEIRAMGLALER
jgi:glycine C-acetyltransferase